MGDEALLRATLGWIEACFAEREPEPLVLSGAPRRTEREHGVPALDRWNILGIWRALGRARALVFGGGGLFQDSTSCRSVLYYAGLIELARLRRVPVLLLGQGIGPLRHRATRWSVRHALRHAALVSVRDAESLAQLRAWGLGERAKRGYDLALALAPPESEAELEMKPDRIGRRLLGVVLRETRWDRRQRGEFIAEVAAGLDLIRKQLELEIAFLPFHPPADLGLITEVRAAMRTKSLLIDLAAASVDEVLPVVGQLALLLGMRLHALEFALLQGVPFLALSYDPKIDSFVKLVRETAALELPLLALPEVSRERLLQGIASLWERQTALHESLHGCAGRLHAAAQEHLDELCQQARKLLR